MIASASAHFDFCSSSTFSSTKGRLSAQLRQNGVSSAAPLHQRSRASSQRSAKDSRICGGVSVRSVEKKQSSRRRPFGFATATMPPPRADLLGAAGEQEEINGTQKGRPCT